MHIYAAETLSRTKKTLWTRFREKLPPEKKEHYAECSECGEIFDRRSLDEVLFHHADHKHCPEIQYSGSTRL
jgi:hypothetical protein